MKLLRSLLLVPALAFAFVGCSTVKSALSQLPPATATSATFELSGKFTSTTVTASNYVNDGQKIMADSLVIDHTNPWVTKFHWELKGASLEINPPAAKQP